MIKTVYGGCHKVFKFNNLESSTYEKSSFSIATQKLLDKNFYT